MNKKQDPLLLPDIINRLFQSIITPHISLFFRTDNPLTKPLTLKKILKKLTAIANIFISNAF